VRNLTNNDILRKTSDESILKNKDKMINHTESGQNIYSGNKFNKQNLGSFL